MEKKSIKGTRTEHNLLAAFAGESQARTRYTLFARKAIEEGYQQIASIFMETAEQELAHAQQFFARLEGGMVEIKAGYPAGMVGTTEENLAAAAAGEREEWSDLYTDFAKVAEEEGFKDVAILFKNIAKVEVEHEERYLKLLDRLRTGTEFTQDTDTEWQCRYCGYVHTGKSAPRKCPVCGADQGWFERKKHNL